MYLIINKPFFSKIILIFFFSFLTRSKTIDIFFTLTFKGPTKIIIIYQKPPLKLKMKVLLLLQKIMIDTKIKQRRYTDRNVQKTISKCVKRQRYVSSSYQKLHVY
jgi:hypothetical protein